MAAAPSCFAGREHGKPRKTPLGANDGAFTRAIGARRG
jgi:hypothetical protein